MKARLASPVGRRGQYVAMWDGPCGTQHWHRAVHPVPGWPADADGPPPLDEDRARGWDGTCERCGTPIDWDDDTTKVTSMAHTIWDTPSGELEPGCLYWDTYRHEASHCWYGWSNCDGLHLHAILPTGRPWDIDSRASNCALPDDTVHRCWVRTGQPPNVHVSKEGGPTCMAGAGSIATHDWHGFLHHGEFTPC